MSNRVEAMMKIGETAESTLRQILSVFPPISNDPGIDSVVYLDRGIPVFYFGVSDRTDKPYSLIQGIEVKPDHANYVTSTSCRQVQEISLDRVSNPNELAHQLFDKILGTEP